MLKIKRIYDTPSDKDGYRVLIDRLWPRGMKKKAAVIDLWMKEIAPSTGLRKWFHQGAENWAEFKMRYEHELSQNASADDLAELIRNKSDVTLLYAAHDEQQNHAIILQQFLNNKLKGRPVNH